MDGFSRKGGVLLVSNHLSYADPVFIGAAFPRKIRYLAYSGLAQSRVMRFVFRLTDTVTVSTNRSLDSMKTCVRRLKQGLPLCVFAEGGISRTGSVFAFKRGVLLLAKQANVPICPVHIDGVWGSVFSMQRGRFFFKKPLSFPYLVTVRVGAEMKANSANSADVQLAVLNLGLDSFAERIPSAQKVGKLIKKSLRKCPQEEFICFGNTLSLSRGEVAEFLTVGIEAKKYLSIPEENMRWMDSMLSTFQEVTGPTKIWSSFLRVSETHLWDQEGFTVQVSEYLKPEWILWVAYLGLCKVEYKNGFLSVWHSNKSEAIDLQLVNGLSSDRNGLISLNFKSVAEQNGDFDEMERGFKRNSLGRLLPGLSYVKEPRFGILGIDRSRDEVDFVKGLDEDGFLEVK
jgi:1-acyl-sn-glycerol-3-phosphate acyltransferase